VPNARGENNVETLVGINLGGYTLMRVLGSGGMGTVYLAEDGAVGQQVAIKVVRTADDETYDAMLTKSRAADRFRQEARAVAALDHLHILPLYRYGEEETVYGTQAYMVMQYRPEGSLLDWQKKRARLAHAAITSESQETIQLPPGLPTDWPLSLAEAADYLMQAASALQYAHDRGIIHRDIKPANFLLRFDTNPTTGKHSALLLLSDFGLAKFFSSSSATSTILGTPTYMAPEQFNGNAGPESDQYALAIMIYYLLAGRLPFTGDPIHLLTQHLNAEPPPIRTFVPTLPASIEQVLAHALAKKPAERYASVSAFAEDFTQHIHDPQPEVSHTLVAPSRSSLPTQPSTMEASSPHLSTQQQVPSQQPMTLPNSPSSTAYSTVPAFSREDYASPTLFHNAPQLSPLPPVQSQQMMVAPTLSPESENMSGPVLGTQDMSQHTSRRSALGWIFGGITVLGLGIGAGLRLYWHEKQPSSSQSSNSSATSSSGQPSSASSGIKYIFRGHTAEVTSLSWSPDGSQLASASLDHSVRLWNLSTQQNTITYLGHTQGILAVAWSHHSNLLASGGEDKTILVCDTTGNTLYQFANLPGSVERVIWTPNDQRILVDIYDHRVQEIILSSSKVTAVGRGFGVNSLALAPNGRYVAIGTQLGAIIIYDTTSLSRPVLEKQIHLGRIRSLAWSPDSTLLASGGVDRTVQVIDMTTQTVANTLLLGATINDISWEPGNTGRLAIASNSGAVIVWNLNTGNYTLHLGHQGPVTTVAWGQQALASGSTDKTVIIWSV
jgi:eukaryotic-like serine/threonine-protein kinase